MWSLSMQGLHVMKNLTVIPYKLNQENLSLLDKLI